jgi:hypothetical protein
MANSSVTGLSLFSSLMNLFRGQFYMLFSLRTGEVFHRELLGRVLRYPQSFFDTYATFVVERFLRFFVSLLFLTLYCD